MCRAQPTPLNSSEEKLLTQSLKLMTVYVLHNTFVTSVRVHLAHQYFKDTCQIGLFFLKSLRVIRRPAHCKAVQALQHGYNDILKTLIYIFEARKSKPKTNETQNVYSKSC